ncbi:PAS domain S-box-containing protein [Halobiforma haloterrestris]|uniref:histidine kinase n=1 Tax=Natronobacterium haloterrestre TaxID=148448 RepID=A0A1I1JW32_NATHA|nr:PAS domain S-box protein [Halobiforma haloterrestris]SFC52182.1 PAS domain S-box-containing protein [Halobiforma haloterrestris]
MSTRSGSSEEAFWGDGDANVALQRYRTLVNTIDDGIYQLDREGHFVAVNDVIVETTGYSRDELLGEHVSLVLADGDIERIERGITSQLESDGDGIATFELAVQTADGGAVPCELRISPLIEDGEFQGTIGVARDISETKHRLDSLASAHASYEAITNVLDEANVGVFILDDGFDVAWVDETACGYFDLDRDDLIGRNKRQVVTEIARGGIVDSERFVDRILSTYDDNDYVERFEFRVSPGDDRQERWLEHYSEPIESGQYAGGRIELYYDITERKRSEDALRETEERFQSLVDAVEEYAIFRLDTEGNVISWNEGAKEIKGYEASDILGEHFSRFYTADDQAAGVPERNLQRALENGSTEDEGWRVRKDGTQFWANVTITAVWDDDGTHRGYLKVTRDMTDRRRREQELETELQRILGRISDAFFAVDEDFRFTLVNERAEELLQRSEEELLKERLWDVLPAAAEIDEMWDAFHTAMNSQRATSYELYYEPLDFWIEANLYPSESGISVYFRDVTERKERERALQERERQLSTLMDNVPGMVYRCRNERGWPMEFVSDACLELTGYDSDSLESGDIEWGRDIMVEEERDTLWETVQRTTEEEPMFSETYRIETADGERRWVKDYGRAVFDDGTLASVEGIIEDVTERKERERALEHRAQQQQVVADLGQFALETDDVDELMHEAARNVAEVLDNDYCKVLDLDSSERELLLRQGVGWDEGVVGNATTAVDDNSQAGYTLLSEEPVVVDDLDAETRFSGPELLTAHDVQSGISTIIGSIDNPWGILGTHDTTKRDFTEEDVTFVQSVANILAEAIERNRYQRELEEVISDLRESNERLEQFAYAASHDLQEPLRMISSYLQLIEDRYGDELDEDGEEFLEFAVDGADRMREMIDGLLEYSRVESRGEPLQPVDLDAVLDDVRDDLRVKIEENDTEISADPLPRVNGDEGQLRQVFQNLLENAIEYSGDEPPEVDITAERDGDEWVISVSDRGIGIDPEDTDRIFEVFQSLHGPDDHSGTGIGLALCERIVERHDGDIWVDSEPGEGATFSFTLPAVRKASSD